MNVVDNGEAEQLAHAHHDDSHDAAEIITNMRAEGSGGTELCPTTDSAAHRRLVMEVHEAMTPANCRRENRSLATRMKNLYESCRLIMWLYGINNGESVETRQRLKRLIDDRLAFNIQEQVEQIVGAATESKVTKAARNAIKLWLEIDEGPAPFAFAGFTYDDYANYLRSQMRRGNGAPLRGKCYKNKRSNLNNLFKRFKYQPSLEFQEKVDAYLDGVVRVVAAAAAQNGIGSIVSGKREMSFELYEKLMGWFLMERLHEGIFARAFLALTWNLMCRGVNSCVCLKHLLWKNDSFGLSFSHVKNDQDGSRNHHPRHIYANPDNYLVCCVTALFEYLLCYPGLFKDEHSMLFPGPCQEARFSDNLSRVLEKHKDELRDLGYSPEDIGVHSIRKGAGTYASSGTTAAPSSVAVNNRGGWTLGGSRDVYLLYERAGDQYVGRILSGMDVLSPKFGASCPDFIYCGRQGVELEGGSEHVADVERSQNELTHKVSLSLEACFGNLNSFVAIRKTLRFGLASLLQHFDAAVYYHGVTVNSNDHVLHEDDGDNARVAPSPLSLSPVFRNEMILNLKQYVKVIYPGDATDDVSQQCIMRLTGIPPHVVQLAQIKQLQQSVASMRPTILEGVEQMLDDRTINGTLSETRMRSLMVSVMEEGQSQILMEVRRAGEILTEVASQQLPIVPQIPIGTRLYEGMDDGASTVHNLWLHKGQCALRFVRRSDVDFHKDAYRRLEEFRFLMWRFDEAARQVGLLRSTMTEMDCNDAITATIESLGVPLETNTGRQRHLERLKWTRYLKLVPDKRRPTREEHQTTYGRQTGQARV
ncbi:hypothetical protein MHU86_6656 [Fragilaria crotonensis]|nr:hypothetical protein MHU86_6656 [Fragilaria crotonensis]